MLCGMSSLSTTGLEGNGNYSRSDTSICVLMTAVHVTAIDGNYRQLYIILPVSGVGQASIRGYKPLCLLPFSQIST